MSELAPVQPRLIFVGYVMATTVPALGAVPTPLHATTSNPITSQSKSVSMLSAMNTTVLVTVYWTTIAATSVGVTVLLVSALPHKQHPLPTS